MKKNYFKLILAAFIMSSALYTFHSCSTDEDATSSIPSTGIAIDPNNFKGEVTNGEVVTLDPKKEYILNGSVTVKNGGKLVIPAGIKITAAAGAASYILVEQGGQIFANGTTLSPVLFTSTPTSSGSWGGIIICGKAPINTGTSGTSEIGNATYGGTDKTDNSGSLNYVRVEYAGASFEGEKKFNGISLFGVGNTTKVDNVSLLNSDDDGIEIYGGTVAISNIVSSGNKNTAFTFKDGWTGSATNIFTKRGTDGTGNNAIKGINNNTNFNAAPRSNPTIKNGTFIGGTSNESSGIQLKNGTYASLENIVLSNWSTGITLESDSTVVSFNGKKRITDVLFKNTTTEVSLKSSAGTNVAIIDITYTKKSDAIGAGNGTSVPTWAVGWSGLSL